MSDYSKGAAYIEKKIVPVSKAKISILDWGFLHSDATYDVVHVWDGRFFRLTDHLERFFSGMQRLHMSIPYSREQVHDILNDCVNACGFQQSYVEMIATRGQPEPGSRDPRSCVNQFFAFAIPFVWICPPEKGMNLVLSQRQRIPPESVNPEVKNYHWLDLVMGQFEAYTKSAEAAVLVNSHGDITEGPGFNIFAIKDAVITTPAVGILKGITRKTVIELARHKGFDVIEGQLSPEQVQTADEVFASSTAGGILPVTAFNQQPVGTGKPGTITQSLQKQYWQLHRDPHFSTPVNYS